VIGALSSRSARLVSWSFARQGKTPHGAARLG
jgi:hypothetical protein